MPSHDGFGGNLTVICKTKMWLFAAACFASQVFCIWQLDIINASFCRRRACRDGMSHEKESPQRERQVFKMPGLHHQHLKKQLIGPPLLSESQSHPFPCFSSGHDDDEEEEQLQSGALPNTLLHLTASILNKLSYILLQHQTRQNSIRFDQ